jgi:hypothetical protein
MVLHFQECALGSKALASRLVRETELVLEAATATEARLRSEFGTNADVQGTLEAVAGMRNDIDQLRGSAATE